MAKDQPRDGGGRWKAALGGIFSVAERPAPVLVSGPEKSIEPSLPQELGKPLGLLVPLSWVDRLTTKPPYSTDNKTAALYGIHEHPNAVIVADDDTALVDLVIRRPDFTEIDVARTLEFLGEAVNHADPRRRDAAQHVRQALQLRLTQLPLTAPMQDLLASHGFSVGPEGPARCTRCMRFVAAGQSACPAGECNAMGASERRGRLLSAAALIDATAAQANPGLAGKEYQRAQDALHAAETDIQSYLDAFTPEGRHDVFLKALDDKLVPDAEPLHTLRSVRLTVALGGETAEITPRDAVRPSLSEATPVLLSKLIAQLPAHELLEPRNLGPAMDHVGRLIDRSRLSEGDKRVLAEAQTRFRELLTNHMSTWTEDRNIRTHANETWETQSSAKTKETTVSAEVAASLNLTGPQVSATAGVSRTFGRSETTENGGSEISSQSQERTTFEHPSAPAMRALLAELDAKVSLPGPRPSGFSTLDG